MVREEWSGNRNLRQSIALLIPCHQTPRGTDCSGRLQLRKRGLPMSPRVASVRIRRRPLLAAISLAPFAGALARVPGAQAQDPLVVTMVTDTQGLGDQNFNDLA